MASKPISKKIEKRVKKGAKAVEKKAKAVEKKAKSVEKTVKKKLKARNSPSKAKVAGVAAAGVAGIAGIAAALHYLRRDSKGRAKLHVVANDAEWHVTAEGKDDPVERFSTKEEAVEAGRKAAQEAAPSDLTIHRLDGSVMRSHGYEPEE